MTASVAAVDTLGRPLAGTAQLFLIALGFTALTPITAPQPASDFRTRRATTFEVPQTEG